MEACIYRVPSQIRDVKPEAYTPRMVLIGPLHLSVKLKPGYLESEYKKMEDKKIAYLESFKKRVGSKFVKGMKKKIRAEETNIRANYEDRARCISSKAFVELILKDSIFIMEFIIKLQEERSLIFAKTREESTPLDHIVERPIYTEIVIADLILLENQLPYFILDQLFGPDLMESLKFESLERVILELFSLHTKIITNTNFKHFTDLFRCVYEESLDQSPKLNYLSGPAIAEMKNADGLHRVGVEFKAFQSLNSSKQNGIQRLIFWNKQSEDLLPVSMRKEDDDFSLHMAFDKGWLVMSRFHLDDRYEKILRNVIAYEQCHVASTPYTCNYIQFINFLITNDRDVEVLTAEGVLTHRMGRPSLVVEMVNKLNSGLKKPENSQYHILATNLRAHYKSRRKRCWAMLNRNYFSDLWTGTATVAAILMLLFTLLGTVASLIQAYKSFDPSH